MKIKTINLQGATRNYNAFNTLLANNNVVNKVLFAPSSHVATSDLITSFNYLFALVTGNSNKTIIDFFGFTDTNYTAELSIIDDDGSTYDIVANYSDTKLESYLVFKENLIHYSNMSPSNTSNLLPFYLEYLIDNINFIDLTNDLALEELFVTESQQIMNDGAMLSYFNTLAIKLNIVDENIDIRDNNLAIFRGNKYCTFPLLIENQDPIVYDLYFAMRAAINLKHKHQVNVIFMDPRKNISSYIYSEFLRLTDHLHCQTLFVQKEYIEINEIDKIILW